MSRTSSNTWWKVGAGGLALGLLGRELIRRKLEADLTGDVALVTGGSRGLGFLIARELLDAGCRVAICARDPAELARARQELDPLHAQVMTIPCDVSDQDQVERMVEEVRRGLGPVDLLVNNAGVIQVGPVQSMTVADFESSLDIMFWGVVYPTLAVLPDMQARGRGRIANVTSIGGKVSVPHLLPYGCAKFAAVGFSEGLRSEVARDGITVTTIVPGLMRTGSHLNAFFKGDSDHELDWFALGASLPGVSMDAERAASQVVRAIKRGDAEVTLSIPAQMLRIFHALFPGQTSNILSLVNRVLPSDASPGMERGAEVKERQDSSVLDAATSWGTSAAERFQHNLEQGESSKAS